MLILATYFAICVHSAFTLYSFTQISQNKLVKYLEAEYIQTCILSEMYCFLCIVMVIVVTSTTTAEVRMHKWKGSHATIAREG